MSNCSNIETPMPLGEIESILGWVDTFKLSRQTKKINRDFSDAVLLAEILSVHYPKLVEMHNYPARNSHAMKLNNWMTLNRKVLKKLRLNLCCNTMEQLANSVPGIIERVLVMVRDKINRDEEINKSQTKDAEQTTSSGGSYYEACGDAENILVIPMKTRVNGVLETIQRKVISYEIYATQKQEMSDIKETTEVLKQKVEHLENLLKLKDERIDELQKQLDRKQARRKEVETIQNSLAVPFETVPSPHHPATIEYIAKPIPTLPLTKIPSAKSIEAKIQKNYESNVFKIEVNPKLSKPSLTDVDQLDRIKSDVFEEIEIIEEANNQDFEEFKDSEQDTMTTINDTINHEMTEISNSFGIVLNLKG